MWQYPGRRVRGAVHQPGFPVAGVPIAPVYPVGGVVMPGYPVPMGIPVPPPMPMMPQMPVQQVPVQQPAQPAYCPQGGDILACFRYDDPMGVSRIMAALQTVARELPDRSRRLPIMFGVGTPTMEFDSFGPKVGRFLRMDRRFDGYQVGDTSYPADGTNLIFRIGEAQGMAFQNRMRAFVVAFDAAAGPVGEMLVKRGPLHPGAGLGRSLPPVGDVSILLGTGRDSYERAAANTRLTDHAARKTAEAIIRFFEMWKNGTL